MTNHYALINKLTTKPGKRDEVIKILLESGKSFIDNAACILYLVCEDATELDIIWVEDVWTSKEAHTAALAQPELRSFIARTIPLLEGMPEQVEVVPAGGKGL
ncbi:MAG TPA: antibiotic biosynthesis monooxygenase [Ktedonobacterales bacterium]|jgi:quinol monooxygenase YgiN|nr:antibiotic biosynthesis monooxygenase [Ktedonobacterales bacterium]